jgi:hypothetical protein
MVTCFGPPFIARLFRASQGGITIALAIGLAVLGTAAIGSIDLYCVVADRSTMQQIADSTALAAASQLLVDSSASTAQRAEAFAQPQLSALLDQWNPSVSSQVVASGTGVQVTISGHRPSRILGLIPSGGWNVSVSATAQSEGSMPLCALGTGTSSLLESVVSVSNSGEITAPNCLIQSDQNLTVGSGAAISAGAASAAGEASGNISPSPQSGAPAIADPFAALNVSVPSLCTDVNFSLTNGPATLSPGVHCGTLTITGPSTLTLAPGTHYFFGCAVTLTGSAVLQGTDVTLVFDVTSTMGFTGSAGVNLSGATSGPFAGFVIAATRDNVSTFTISTTAAKVLEGVVYLPSATLSIPGYAPVNNEANWTVIVAKNIAVSGTAELVLNTNYSSSTVPVPGGVDGSGGHLVLTR